MMRPLARSVIGVLLLAALALPAAGCGGEPSGACLYDVTDAVVCYEGASASCCQQIGGDFHPADSCSKYPGTRVEPVFFSGCSGQI